MSLTFQISFVGDRSIDAGRNPKERSRLLSAYLMQRCHAATLNWPAPGAGAYGPHPGDRLASGEGEQRECGDIEAIRRSMVALPQLCSLPPWPVTHVDYHKGLPFEFDANAISSPRKR